MFHGSFDQNEDAVLDRMEEAIRKCEAGEKVVRCWLEVALIVCAQSFLHLLKEFPRPRILAWIRNEGLS
jgi:hypothetical protein